MDERVEHLRKQIETFIGEMALEYKLSEDEVRQIAINEIKNLRNDVNFNL